SIPENRVMSKSFLRLVLALAACMLFLSSAQMNAQIPVVTIKIDAASPTLARVEGRFPKLAEADRPPVSSFMTETAGVSGLEKRISDLSVVQSTNNVSSWTYVADLKPIDKTQAATHVSWLGPNGGILVLDDLFPQGTIDMSGHSRA